MYPQTQWFHIIKIYSEETVIYKEVYAKIFVEEPIIGWYSLGCY